MSITTVSLIRYITYEFYIKRPKQMCELNLKKVFDEKPPLINALKRNVNHVLVENIDISHFVH